MGTGPRSLLIHRMDLEERTVTQGDLMDDTYTWSKKQRNVRCRLQPIKSMERVLLMREGVKVTHRLFLGTRIPVDPNDRFVMGTRTFKIKGSINPDEMDQYLQCDLWEEL